MYRAAVSRSREQLTMLANFVEVYLAREGHGHPVGINLLTKIQLPTLASLYGAMLAGVDCVLMGAGIPREIPAVLDAFAEHRPAAIRFEVEGLPSGATEHLRLDPGEHWSRPPAPLQRPLFLPIIASNSLATVLARKASGRVDGFIIEGPTAGGHNAPPRGDPTFNERGEPLYGERDVVDLAKVRELGLPFWLAGGTGHPGRLREAQEAGAAGIQVGTLFAYCDESARRPRASGSAISVTCASPISRRTAPSTIAAPASRWTPTCARGGRRRTLWGDAACATRCSRTSAIPRRGPGGRWSRHCSPAATIWFRCRPSWRAVPGIRRRR
jgi:nitronate monooxygenase